jgi:hypothetical protein
MGWGKKLEKLDWFSLASELLDEDDKLIKLIISI